MSSSTRTRREARDSVSEPPQLVRSSSEQLAVSGSSRRKAEVEAEEVRALEEEVSASHKPRGLAVGREHGWVCEDMQKFGRVRVLKAKPSTPLPYFQNSKP